MFAIAQASAEARTSASTREVNGTRLDLGGCRGGGCASQISVAKILSVFKAVFFCGMLEQNKSLMSIYTELPIPVLEYVLTVL